MSNRTNRSSPQALSSSPHHHPLSRTPSYQTSMSFSPVLNESQNRDLAYLAKRSAHNALERQRREGLNSKFQELAHVLPSLQQVKRPSKGMIVAKSLEFVSAASQRENEFQKQLLDLREENERLMNQVKGSKRKRTRNSEGSSKRKKTLQTRRSSVSSSTSHQALPNTTFLETSSYDLNLLNDFYMPQEGYDTSPLYWNYK